MAKRKLPGGGRGCTSRVEDYWALSVSQRRKLGVLASGGRDLDEIFENI